ncbi:MAG: hypothetical protein GY953_38480 [bacterium]|nr:hypothetical protein [bacterium]
MRWLLSLVLAAPLFAADSPKIFYSRDFRPARPPYIQIVVERDGSAVYRESVDDPDEQPVEFKLRTEEVDELFALAEKCDHFQRKLESGLEVARMGDKTLRWISPDGATHEQVFNYTQDPDGSAVAKWFNNMTQSVNHFLALERTARFDKLGVNKVLLQMEISIHRGRLVAQEMYLPLLDRVANNESYLNMARDRAAAIAHYIRNPPAEPEAAGP